jgi:hypothetical protein
LSAFRCGLCLIQGGDPQPYQIGGALLRGARLGDPVQFDPPRRDPDADLGTDDRNRPDREAALAAMVADTPLRRFGRTDEVAALAVLLASDEATYITGSEMDIDGGLLAGSAASPK